MSEMSVTLRRIPAAARAALGLALAWGSSLQLTDGLWRLSHWLRNHGWENVAHGLLELGSLFRQSAVDPLLFLVSLAVPVALLVRMIARARVRAGLPDPLDAARAWTERHRRLTSTAVALPAVLWVASPLRHLAAAIGELLRTSSTPIAELGAWTGTPSFIGWSVFVAILAVTAFGARAGLRRGVTAFLSPTVSADRAAPVSGERIGFDAVAVTAETRGAVGAMGALGIGMFAAMLVARPGSTVAPMALAAYGAVTLAAL